ncbi:hypothetical protein [Actinophytocola sp.]|uniref:hypothetical protein n=1 Tax=Actinophytocola sp. TaxID=1872138 RepID=UPI002D58F2E9|nr:hypothetical protein [Actinophytocola sp.]HYQ69660.1 hypothetical protein [Actinophytocola sp.]
MLSDLVVLVLPATNDGTVVRWYRDLLSARNGNAIATASRSGVTVAFAPRYVADAAYEAYQVLAADRDADVSYLATHTRAGGFLGAELVPVAETAPVEEKPAFRITIADRFGGAPR